MADITVVFNGADAHDWTARRNIFDEVARIVITQALDASGGCMTTAAKMLGIYRQTLQRKMRKLGMR